MAKSTSEGRGLQWPAWSIWALVAIGITSALTIAATLYDIL